MRGPNAQVVDLQGCTAIPGLTDAQVHLPNVGNPQRNVDLVGTTSYDDVIARISTRAKDRSTPAEYQAPVP
jgi:hypothetical protein